MRSSYTKTRKREKGTNTFINTREGKAPLTGIQGKRDTFLPVWLSPDKPHGRVVKGASAGTGAGAGAEEVVITKNS